MTNKNHQRTNSSITRLDLVDSRILNEYLHYYATEVAKSLYLIQIIFINYFPIFWEQ